MDAPSARWSCEDVVSAAPENVLRPCQAATNPEAMHESVECRREPTTADRSPTSSRRALGLTLRLRFELGLGRGWRRGAGQDRVRLRVSVSVSAHGFHLY